GRGPRSVYGEALPMGVLATDRFSVLSVRRNGADTSEAVYWESQHQQWMQLEQGQVRFNRPPVSEGTALVLSFNLRRDDFLGTLERDRHSSDAAMMSAVGYSQGIHETAVWLGNKIANRSTDEPLVIVLHGRHGVGKTFTKDLILAALEEMGYEFDETRQNRSRKAVHRYNAWRAEDNLDEAWRSNFFGHRGIVIAETVEMPVPENWRQADNLLFIHMQANQKRRRQRIERKGEAYAGQLPIKSVHESSTELRTFANRIIIANSDIDMNKRFLSIMKFQYAFEQASSDVAMLAKTVFYRTADDTVIRDILAGMAPDKIALRIADGQMFRVWLAGGTVRQEPVSPADFHRIHREDHNPVVITARGEDLDVYLNNRIPRQAVLKIDHNGIYVDGIKQENIGDYHDVVHFAFARMAAETPFEKSYVLDAIVFESLFGKGVSTQDQLMTRAYEELVVRKVENYFTNLAKGRDDARERMDAQMDAVLAKVGWSPEHLRRLIALVRELREELDRNGSLQIVHQIHSRLTSADVPVRQYDAADAAVMAADRTSQDPLGGIDLNPANMTLETRGDGGDFHFQFDPGLQKDLHLDGFIPVIINITPVNTLPLLLGDSADPAGPANHISNNTPATSRTDNRAFTTPSPDKISRR
ncbi:MAG: hypothetical protein K8I00_04915, partial [Candidatus Omnitrophica bacterium]|nr:hypothetical protein [Candidatus Omnitrophota bacterium]